MSRASLLGRIATLEARLDVLRQRLATLDHAPPPRRWSRPKVPILHEPTGRRFACAQEAAVAEGVDRTTIVQRCNVGKDGWRRDAR